VLKDLKESTKQRFGAIQFDYPPPEVEAEIIAHEARVDRNLAQQLVGIAERSRNLKGHGLEEGASTRMLIQAGRLVARGASLQAACRTALVLPITDDEDIRAALTAAISACL
jgi:nitric oxide reductase NorQ protein